MKVMPLMIMLTVLAAAAACSHDGIAQMLDLDSTRDTVARPVDTGIVASPEDDSDGDGVPDSKDECPDSPRGYGVDDHGCVDMTELFADRILNISYPSGGSGLSMKAMNCLDTLASLLTDFEDVTVTIVGYTDNIGDAAANQRLSLKRASIIRDYLVLRGISENRLRAVGKGETDFVAPNSTRYGREKNRRIEAEFKY